VTAGVGVLLIATLIVSASRPTGDPSVACADGTLKVVGSSAFSPIVNTIAGEYLRACGRADVTVEATGSIGGMRQLAALDPAQRGTLAALSDGQTSETNPELVEQAVAVIVYAVVVNDSAGLDRLTLDQVKGIYAGRYRDWNELRPGPSLPIRIVSRGQESGSRHTFEKTTLGTPEGPLSSDSCETRDRGVQTRPSGVSGGARRRSSTRSSRPRARSATWTCRRPTPPRRTSSR
jgi:phosphate transport system substrate-binding protein